MKIYIIETDRELYLAVKDEWTTNLTTKYRATKEYDFVIANFLLWNWIR